jgi:hypothetical protein
MASNKGHNEANAMISEDRSQAQDLNNYTNNQYKQTGQQGNELFEQLRSGYGNMAGGGMNYGQGATAGASSGGGGGYSYQAPSGPNSSYGISMPGYKTFADTGGYDADTKSQLMGDVGVARTIGQTGGIDADAQSRMRGAGVFDEMARTGGVGDTEARLMRARGQSSVGSTFQGLRGDVARQNSAQGGIGFGAAGAQGSLARSAARTLGDQAVNTDLSIAQQRATGRMQGAQALSGAEGSLQSQLVGNKLAGANQAGSQQMKMQDSINQGMQWGLSKQEATKRAEEQAQAEAARSAASAAQASQADQYRQYQYNMGLQNQGLEGLQGLYNSKPGAAGMYGGLAYGGLGQQSNSSGQYAQSNPYNSPMSQISQGIGALSGGVSAAMGIPGLGPKTK